MGKQDVVSCYQCAGIAACYGSKQPALDREEARAKAKACSLWHKGRTTETVKVVGRDRGMSRGKAQRKVEEGEAVWVGPGVVRLQGK